MSTAVMHLLRGQAETFVAINHVTDSRLSDDNSIITFDGYVVILSINDYTTSYSAQCYFQQEYLRNILLSTQYVLHKQGTEQHPSARIHNITHLVRTRTSSTCHGATPVQTRLLKINR
jgi:hypothetical protein